MGTAKPLNSEELLVRGTEVATKGERESSLLG